MGPFLEKFPSLLGWAIYRARLAWHPAEQWRVPHPQLVTGRTPSQGSSSPRGQGHSPDGDRPPMSPWLLLDTCSTRPSLDLGQALPPPSSQGTLPMEATAAGAAPSCPPRLGLAMSACSGLWVQKRSEPSRGVAASSGAQRYPPAALWSTSTLCCGQQAHSLTGQQGLSG